MSMVAINLDGFAVNFFNNFDKKPACFFSISIWILFDETKAISIPEKNADSKRDKTMMKVSEVMPL